MADITKIGLILMFVALVAAVGLGFVNRITAPIIEIQEEMKKQEAMNSVAGTLTSGDSLAFDSIAVDGLANPYAACGDTLKIVKVTTEPDSVEAGYLFIAYGKGYSSTLQTMVAVDMSGLVHGSTILFQMETPGLGANVTDPDKLLIKFNGRDSQGILLRKDTGDIDAMTGCTITSRAVADAVRDGLEAMDEVGLFTDAEGGEEVSPQPDSQVRDPEDVESAATSVDSTVVVSDETGESEGGAE